MGALEHPCVPAHDLPSAIATSRSGIRKLTGRLANEAGCRDVVAVGLEVHEAGRRHPFGVLDEPVEGPAQWHQARPLLGVQGCDAAWQDEVAQDAAARDTTQHTERLGQGIEQHLVGLQPVGPDHESLAVCQLGVRRLQLDPFAG